MTGLATAIAISFVTGFVLGAAYFTSLWFFVLALTRRQARWRTFAVGGIVRLAAALVVLAALLGLGADPALIPVGAVGFLAARFAATGWARMSGSAGTGERQG